MIRRIVLRHLSFVGKGIEPAVLQLQDGVNVVYGASNTGKSFSAEAIDFMLGAGDPLPEDVEQLADYQEVLLGLTLPQLGDVTLSRGITGGSFALFLGLHVSKPAGAPARNLSARHNSGNRESNLSALLLDLLGFQALEVVRKTTTGEKMAFSFRGVAPFSVVKEDAMLSTNGPAFSNDRQEPAEQSIFRTLLTGNDDSAVVSTVDPKIRRAQLSGKVEFVDELLMQIDTKLGSDDATEQDLRDQAARLTNQLENLQSHLKQRQEKVDEVTILRRSIQDQIVRQEESSAELALSVGRFAELDAVYDTDLKRLVAIEEGGVVLLEMAKRSCPLCGADAEHQKHHHDLEEARVTFMAAKEEKAKISRDKALLGATTDALRAEIDQNKSRLQQLRADLEGAERALTHYRPLESSSRRDYEELSATRREIADRLALFDEKSRLAQRRELLVKEGKSSPKSLNLSVAPSGPVGHELAQCIQGVLKAWGYPGDFTVSFDVEALDIRIDGKIRTANGKGVRALLHAAFNVGLLVFCRKKELPHPGFLVLDTPLLTYREPEKIARHGAIQDDEKAVRASGLRQKFFEYLHGFKDAQFLILENVDPPADVTVAKTFFSGELDNGRFGLFPPKQAGQATAIASTSP